MRHPDGLHLVVTDSGIGGLAVCAELERAFSASGPPGRLRLTYVNAWPFEGRGYNDLPDLPERAAVFDRALARMATLAPDRILIACNTLSIVYEHTAFGRAGTVPVRGIVDAGVAMFVDALAGAPEAAIALLGTRTTIESRVHRDGLVARGVAANRVIGVSCHGLAGAVEREIAGPRVTDLIAVCARAVKDAVAPGALVFAGLCCTHYGYIAGRLEEVLSEAVGRRVQALDPNGRMARDVAALYAAPGRPAGSTVTVDVVSKVTLNEAARRGIGRLVGAVSPATARALDAYTHVPDLF